MTWRISGYVAEQLIGYGESSEVWRGRAIRTGAPVALKKVLAPDPEQRQAARAEAAVLANLDHANLIRIHEVIATRDAIVLVLDLADAGSVRDLLQARGQLAPGEVATLISVAGAALAYAHGRRVVHGNVSAGNVLLTSFGLALLTDFGAARLAGTDAPGRATAAYLCPEIAAGGLAHTSGDVFSLAAVAFHALTGTPVWGAGSTPELLARARSAQPADLAQRLADVPPELATVLLSALDREAHRRPSAAEFALDVRLSVPLVPIDVRAGRPRPEPLPPAGGRHRRAAVPTPAISPAPGRPRFERPLPTAPDRGLLTHGVRIALAPPSPVRWWRRWRPLGLVAVVLLLALAGAGVAYRAGPTRSAAARTATDFGATLTALDAVREAAFAQRRPELLAQVYASAQLQSQDAAQIARLVPAGCGLLGVQTTYRDVRLVSAASSAEVIVQASAQLAPSQLRCGAQPSAPTAGVAATPLRIGLVHRGGNYLIDSVRAQT